MATKMDPTPVEARVAALVAEMTLDEKLGLVTGHYPVVMRDEDRPADALIAAGYVPGVPRLGIPALKETDASLGVSNVLEMRPGDTATALPCGLSMGATWDPDLIEEGGRMIGLEAKRKGFHVLLAGGVNVIRDAWNGRNFEYLSEDPLHSGLLGGAAIRGVQSNQMISTIKHFALNPQETARKVMNAQIDEAAFRESDLLAFQLAIEIGNPFSVMCSYNRINGHYASANRFLLTDVLRKDWDYRGWVMSDWGAVHATAETAMAGLDQESGQELDSETFFGETLRAAITSGAVPAARLDEMVARIVFGILASGVVDEPPVVGPVDLHAHAERAQRVAEQGIVMLRNEGVLPLDPGAALTIAVIGGHASQGVLSGGGSSQVRSVGGAPIEIALMRGEASGFSRRTYHASSPLHALRAELPNAQIHYTDGTDIESAIHLASQSDLAIVFAEQWQTEAHDVPDLALPDGQDALITAVAGVSQTIVVLETGGAVLMPWLDQVGAVLSAWYPGQRGGEAIARLLSGAVNPSGRLPITFPSAESQLPRPRPPGFDLQEQAELARLPGKPSVAYKIPPFDVEYAEGADVGYRWFERQAHRPLFPFGFGLSYTHFLYDDLSISDGESPSASFNVRNGGDTAGTDTPQLYVRHRSGAMLRLAGWARVSLKSGESRRVTVKLDLRLLADYSVKSGQWEVPAGEMAFFVGSDAVTMTLEAQTAIAGRNVPA